MHGKTNLRHSAAAGRVYLPGSLERRLHAALRRLAARTQPTGRGDGGSLAHRARTADHSTRIVHDSDRGVICSTSNLQRMATIFQPRASLRGAPHCVTSISRCRFGSVLRLAYSKPTPQQNALKRGLFSMSRTSRPRQFLRAHPSVVLCCQESGCSNSTAQII